MSHDDLPLFRWTPPSAEVIPFPVARRVGKIRRTAQLVDESTDKAARAHWNRTVDDLTRQMARAGIPPEHIEAELRAFSGAVLAELAKRSQGASGFRPGGDVA